MLIVGLSPHIVLTYSDGIGMFLSLILTYIIFKLEKDKDIKKDKNKINDDKEKNKLLQKSCISRIILILLFTNLSILGYYIKPQIIIISIAYVIIKILNIPYLTYLVIKNKNEDCKNNRRVRKERIKKEIIYYIIVSILIIITGCIIYTHIRKANNSMGINVDKEKRFNITHYAMLGWNPESKGVFTIKDENFSGKYEKIKDREKANLEELKRRITEMGLGGVINQIARKILTNYNDGTFSGVATFVYIRKEYNIEGINKELSKFLKNIYYENGKYNMIYTQIMQCLWIGILIFNMFSYNDGKSTKISIVILGIIGLFIFEILFEARSRYIFIYVPLYIFLGVIGLKNALSFFMVKIKGIKNKENVILYICENTKMSKGNV